MTRAKWILLSGLVLQLALTAFVYWPRGAPAAADTPLLVDFDPGQVSGLTIQDDSGDQIRFTRRDGVWVLPEADDFPADNAKIRTMLEKLQAIRTGRLVTRTAASHARLQVAQEQFLRRITVEYPDGNRQVIYLGSSAGPKATHVRLADQNEVYLTGDITIWEAPARANTWVNTSYLQLAQEEITGAVLTNANGVFTFVQDESGGWTMPDLEEGEVFLSDNLDFMLNRLSNLHLLEPLGKSVEPHYGLDSPQAVVELTLTDASGNSRPVVVKVGVQDPRDENYIVSASTSEYIVKVAKNTVDGLVHHSRADFLEPPPTPTEETGEGES